MIIEVIVVLIILSFFIALGVFVEEPAGGFLLLVPVGLILWIITAQNTFDAPPYHEYAEIQTIDYGDGKQTQHYKFDGKTEVTQIRNGAFYDPELYHVEYTYKAGYSYGIWISKEHTEVVRKNNDSELEQN